MKPGPRYIIVKSDHKPEETTQGGIILNRATDHWYNNGSDTRATVVAVPEKLSKSITHDYAKAHDRYAKEGEMVRLMEDKPIAQPGDTVILHPNAMEDARENGQWTYEDGEEHLFVTYNSVICVIRGDEMYGVGQYNVVELIPELPDELTTQSGIITKSTLGTKYQRGILRAKGQDPQGSYDNLRVGETVFWSLTDKKKHIPIEALGEGFARVRWVSVLGKTENVSEEELAKRKALQKEWKAILPQRILAHEVKLPEGSKEEVPARSEFVNPDINKEEPEPTKTLGQMIKSANLKKDWEEIADKIGRPDLKSLNRKDLIQEVISLLSTIDNA